MLNAVTYFWGAEMRRLVYILILMLWVTPLSAQDGTLKWRYETGASISSSPAIGTDGTIYVGSCDYYLYAINPDGTLRWRYKTANLIHSSPTIDSNGTIYIGSSGKYLYAINPDGTLKWKYNMSIWNWNASPSIGADGTVYVGGNDNYIYAFYTDGTLKWRYETGAWVTPSPAIGADNTIYTGSSDHYLYALNPDGTLKWRYETGDWIPSSASIGADGTVYVGSGDQFLYAINSDGTLKWKFQTGATIYTCPVIDTKGVIYFGSYDKYLYALNPDGSLKWKYKTGDYIKSSPAIGTDGTIYFGCNNDYIYALNPSGTARWQYLTEDWVHSSPAIGTDGTVYIGSWDDHLYAIETDCGGLVNSPWPMRGGNVQHSGLYAFPFYCAVNAPMFQVSSGDYYGTLNLIGQNEATQIISCQFTHSSFNANTALPITITAAQTENIDYEIKIDSTDYFDCLCTLGWLTDDDSGDLTLNLSQGIIVKDGSETDVIGSQVLDAFDSSFVRDPGSVATQNNLSLLYRICGEPETADQILSGIEEDALQDYYCADIYLLNRGVVRSDMSQPDTAALYFEGVLHNESETMCAKAWYNQGWEAYQQNDYHQVVLYTDSVLASSMVNDYTLAKAWCLRGAALMGLGQNENASSAFSQAVSLDPTGPIGAMAEENMQQTSVDDDLPVPARFALYPNYPNPFNPVTTIGFDLPESGEVVVTIFNTLGHRVRQLHRGMLQAGHHTVQWDARDDAGCRVGSGIYLLRIETKDHAKVQKLTLMR